MCSWCVLKDTHQTEDTHGRQRLCSWETMGPCQGHTLLVLLNVDRVTKTAPQPKLPIHTQILAHNVGWQLWTTWVFSLKFKFWDLKDTNYIILCLSYSLKFPCQKKKKKHPTPKKEPFPTIAVYSFTISAVLPLKHGTNNWQSHFGADCYIVRYSRLLPAISSKLLIIVGH